MNRIKKSLKPAPLPLLAATLLLTAAPPPRYLAWWGTLYPEYCFSVPQETKEAPAAEKSQEESEAAAPTIKITFWLKKLFQ